MEFSDRYKSVPFLFGCLFAAGSFFFAVTGGVKLYHQKKQQTLMEKSILQIKTENRNLEMEIEKLKSDPETIEKAIRRLGMVKPDETLIVFQTDATASSPSGAR